jgi:hypothetical protein
MTLSVLCERFAVCRLDPDAALPAWATSGRWFSVTRTHEELSLICEERHVPPGVRSAGGWRALRFHGPFDFSEIGVLLPIVAVLARAEISMLALATFDTDYVLLPDDRLPSARAALRAAGHTVEEETTS